MKLQEKLAIEDVEYKASLNNEPFIVLAIAGCFFPPESGKPSFVELLFEYLTKRSVVSLNSILDDLVLIWVTLENQAV